LPISHGMELLPQKQTVHVILDFSAMASKRTSFQSVDEFMIQA